MTVLAEPELKESKSDKKPEPMQQRFFCENCEREVFLNASYCDKCGGKIEWPEKYASIFSKDKQSKKGSNEKKKKED
jgi:hypothetical protein